VDLSEKIALQFATDGFSALVGDRLLIGWRRRKMPKWSGTKFVAAAGKTG